MPEFKPWPVISNMTDRVVVTEMIDGAGAFAIHIERLKFNSATGTLEIRPGDVLDFNKGEMVFYRLTAQSRTRLITPRDDTHGFAKWVAEHASALAAELGEGIHYGEWWGYKINRGYNLEKGDKRFSLFNTERWSYLDGSQVPGLWCVPVIDQGSLFSEANEDTELLDLYTPVHFAVETLREGGSVAAPGYNKPKGVVVFHTGGRVMFKYVFTSIEDPLAKLRATLATGTEIWGSGSPSLQTREDQEEELTRLEQAAYRGEDFDVSQAYADAVNTAIRSYGDKNSGG